MKMTTSGKNIIFKSEDKEIRYATDQDYAAVVAINDNVYNGIDYIPGQYFYYLHRQGTYCFVMEDKQEVVGFSMITVIDEGKSILMHAARFHPKKKHLNYGLYFFGVVIVHILKAHPDLSRVVMTSRPELDNPHKRESILLLHDIVFEVNSLLFRSKQLYNTDVNTSGKSICQIEGQQMKTWLLTHGAVFFPEYIQVDYYPFKYLPGNIDMIVDELKAVCFISKDQAQKYKGVSFHVIHPTVRRWLVCIFHYYGDCKLDFEEHLKHHLNYLKTNKKFKEDEELHLHCNFQQIFRHEDITLMANTYGLRDGVLRPGTMLIQVARDMQQNRDMAIALAKL